MSQLDACGGEKAQETAFLRPFRWTEGILGIFEEIAFQM